MPFPMLYALHPPLFINAVVINDLFLLYLLSIAVFLMHNERPRFQRCFPAFFSLLYLIL
jgi:hypothetical protein